MAGPALKIGEVAHQAGVNVQTLRFYERQGLLPRPARTASGYRQYPAETAQMVTFIKRAQELGFTLAEAKELLRLRAAPVRDRARIRRVANDKIAGIDAKVARLTSMRHALSQLVACCEQDEPLRCSIIEALNGDCAQPLVQIRKARPQES